MRPSWDGNPERQPSEPGQDPRHEAEGTLPTPEREAPEAVPTYGAVPEGKQEVGLQPSPTEEPTAEPQKSNLKPILIEIAQTVLLTLIIFAAVRSVVQNFKVDGASMEPTLHSGQYLLINKLAYVRLEGLTLEAAQRTGLAPNGGGSHYPFGGPQRGDIAVFRYPGRPDRDFIKRVIGLPGDVVQVDRGRVYVNGILLQEDYIRSIPTYSIPRQTVPEGNYFVLGDNRPNSSDSHIWGFVPAENLIGKAWLSYWPPGTWGPVPHTGVAGN